MRDLSNPLKLIELLANGEFHSGEALASQFGMTRAGINKYIKLIRQWGLDIISVQGRGYQLAQPLDLLKISKIKQHYPSIKPLNLEVLPIIDSTNQYLLSKLDTLPSGYACVAEYQQAGRGRRGRQWFSPFGSNLYLLAFRTRSSCCNGIKSCCWNRRCKSTSPIIRSTDKSKMAK